MLLFYPQSFSLQSQVCQHRAWNSWTSLCLSVNLQNHHEHVSCGNQPDPQPTPVCPVSSSHIVNYDWFCFVQDESYTQPERLKTIVSHLSMDLQLYMGQPREFIGGETKGRYCHSGPGFLLSCALLLKLQPFLEHCRTDIVSIRPDEWLGRCIIDYAGISCVDEYEVRGNNKLGLKFGLWHLCNIFMCI